MTNKEKYVNAFVEALEITADKVEGLEYQGIPEWDSVGHMSLIAEIEDAFDIMMDTDDIIDLSSFDKGIEILKKYEVEIRMSKDELTDIFMNELRNAFEECYSRLSNRRIIIYGAGMYGLAMIKAFKFYGMEQNIIAVCDGNSEKWGQELEGFTICGIDNVLEDNENIIVIASQYEEEIKRDLQNCPIEIFDKPLWSGFVENKLAVYDFNTVKVNAMGFKVEWFQEYKEKEIDKLYEDVLSVLADEKSKMLLERRVEFYKTGRLKPLKETSIDKKQYFDTSYYPLSQSEVYADCGAFDGDSVEDFINEIGEFNEIYAFEPDGISYDKLSKRVENLKGKEKIHIFPWAIGEKEGKLKFSSNAIFGSHIDESGNVEVTVRSLDDILPVNTTLIKMDIEGAEYDALLGAKNLIKNSEPKLAICVYHRVEDLFKIPLLIHELNPRYKIIIRQHTEDLYDTILYAYVED